MTYGTVAVHLQRDGRVFVQPYSRTVERSLIVNGLPIVLPSQDDPERLGRTILEAMRLSIETILSARDLRKDPPDRELLAWLGLRSYAQYAKGVRAVKVHGFYDEDEPDHLLVTPEDNGGAENGFTSIREHRVKLTDFSPVVLGEAVQHSSTLATA